jgi:hypothetical protein
VGISSALQEARKKRQTEREARRALWAKDPDKWTNEELVTELGTRYKPTEVPPCKLCGKELSLQAFGGGNPTVWACDGRDENVWREGRKPADDHYRRSQFEDRRQGGDVIVMELVRRFLAKK